MLFVTAVENEMLVWSGKACCVAPETYFLCHYEMLEIKLWFDVSQFTAYSVTGI